MRVDDLMEIMGAIAKLNRTIDEQQRIIDQYAKMFGALPMVEVSDDKENKVDEKEIKEIVTP
jgi:hypothetical protein